MTTNASKPTLLSLPRELRDIIYDYTFISVACRSHFGSHDNTPARCNAGLLLACHQTHNEAIVTYYKNTIFSTPSGGILWYAELPAKYRELVREIRVWIVDWEQEHPICRVRSLERLGQGIYAITRSPIKDTVLKTYFGEGQPSQEEMAEYEGSKWKFVPNLPYRELPMH